ncbi:hypothetical protein [Streptomyces sp. NPDC004266]|uniref:hypothetical protein n=1 Tax=Streptomyces sp. NPDC004266 TaxID=3364693 RepID=UPI0036799268
MLAAVTLLAALPTGRPYAPVTGLTAVLTALAVAAPPLAGRTAAPTTLRLLVPLLLAVTPVLVAVQAWIRYAFRGRVTGPSYL